MSKKYKLAIVGHFADGKDFNDGQTVKTKNLYKALSEHYGADLIKRVDTCGFKKRILSFFIENVKSFLASENTVILPAHNGIKVFIPFFCFLKLFFKRKLHYAVVGGWLPQLLSKHKLLKKLAKKIDAIYVETSSMKYELEQQGFDNIVLLPNFKYLTPLNENELVYNPNLPHKLCIFSRIMQQKGVEDAVQAVKEINTAAKKNIFSLDIYGPVDDGYNERFEKIKSDFPSYIKYCGVVESEKSVEAIKEYFALLFPTRFYTEGVPGTLIDAMASGVPVISALWGNYKDVFVEGVTGWGYEFENTEQFKALLVKAAENPEEFLKMKKSSLEEVKKYKPSEIILQLIKRID